MDPKEQIEKIQQSAVPGKFALTVGVPTQYQKWIGETFFKKVIAVPTHSFKMPIPPYTLVFVNTDVICGVDLYKIKEIQEESKHQKFNLKFFYVTEQQLQYYYENPYWVITSSWPCQDIDEGSYCKKLAYANLVLREAGYRCFRNRYLIPCCYDDYDAYVQSTVWEDLSGNYFVLVFNEVGGNTYIEVDGLHDDVFVIEGFVPIDLSKNDMKTEILALTT